MQVVRKPDSIWLNANLPMKQAIQRLVFPKRVTYAQKERKFRNAEKTGIYALFDKKRSKKAALVDLTGETAKSAIRSLQSWNAVLQQAGFQAFLENAAESGIWEGGVEQQINSNQNRNITPPKNERTSHV